jgi:hypothetical protein
MKTFSKALWAGLFGVVAMASQATAFADPVGPSPKATGVIDFGKMVVNEQGNISYPIINNGGTPLKITYTFSRLDGGAWKPIHSSDIVIPGKGSLTVGVTVPRTKEVQHVRLDVSAVGHVSVAREIKLHAKRVYVLQYKTPGWVQIDYQFQKTTSELIGQGVNAKMAEAKALGFETKRKTERTVVLVGTDSYRTYAYARLDDWKEKTFETKEERDAFHRKILKVVPSYANDGPGLNTKLVER